MSAASSWHPQALNFDTLFTVKIVGPKGLFGVTSGRLQEHFSDGVTTTVVWQSRYPQDSLTLAAGYYQLQEQQLGDIQLLVLLSPQNSSLASDYLESLREYMALYQKLFGPYPYEKFAVVENFYPTGYGLPGWTLLGNRVVRLPFIRTTSLPHEIAHAWWGNAVEIDYSKGNWGEGLATYVADYYLKELQGSAEATEYRKKMVRDYAALVAADNDYPLVDFRSRMSKSDQAIGYGKAAMVFHMLRELIGDTAFWEGLQEIAQQGRGKRYGWNDLQRHFEAVTGEDLQSFFSQWLERSGAPTLALKDIDVIKTGSKWQVSGNIEQAEPVYELAVPLLLETENRQYRQVVGLYRKVDCFVFTVDDTPLRLSLDADNSLFRHLYMDELPATINALRAATSQLVVTATGAEELYAASRDLLRGLHWQKAPVFTETEYLEMKPVNSDVIFLGWPEDEGLQTEISTMIARIKQIIGKPDKVKNGNATLFVAQKTGQAERVIGYFLPGSAEAAQDTARRIPHYGRYSYLAFNNGRNLVKGTWEPDESPLKVLLHKDPRK